MTRACRWTHLALLRGINVGGNNLVRMEELKACLTEAGLGDVRTFIASGNVLFASRTSSTAVLEAKIEKALEASFGRPIAVVVLERSALAAVVERAPKGFGGASFKNNVLFCKRPLTAARALAAVTPKPGVDTATAANGVLYFATLKAKAPRSSLSRLVSTPEYKLLTIRNWNTTVKLHELFSSPA